MLELYVFYKTKKRVKLLNSITFYIIDANKQS